jgi:hypothetical protein
VEQCFLRNARCSAGGSGNPGATFPSTPTLALDRRQRTMTILRCHGGPPRRFGVRDRSVADHCAPGHHYEVLLTDASRAQESTGWVGGKIALAEKL